MASLVKSSSGKKSILIKTWERCRSTPSSSKKKVAPEGFFPVYVGPDKLWFAMKMKYVNHPLFQVLLEDTKIEYGYNAHGPILLPCELDHFYEVLAEIEAKDMEPRGCGFGYASPSRRIVKTGFELMGKVYGGYGVLTPSRLIMTS